MAIGAVTFEYSKYSDEQILELTDRVIDKDFVKINN